MTNKGASRSERVLAACREGQRNLLLDILLKFKSRPERIHFIDSVVDTWGQHCLHLAAKNGHAHVVEFLVDRTGLDVDYVERLDGDTPIHRAIRWINNATPKQINSGSGDHMIFTLMDAGADLTIRNKHKQRPIDLVDPRNKELRLWLMKEQFRREEGAGVVDEESKAEEKDKDADSLLAEVFDIGYEREPLSDDE